MKSLRDIETCLRALGPKLYHAGFRGKFSRSTLADAARAHDWRIYADFAQVLAGSFYVMDRGYVDFKRLRRFSVSAAFGSSGACTKFCKC